MADKEEIEEKTEKDLIQITVIQKGDKMALVEYWPKGDEPVRVTIPIKDIKDSQATSKSLEKGIPFGIPYETLQFPVITAQDISKQLHKYGLWTPDDLRTKPKQVQSVLAELSGQILATLLEYIQNK